MIKTNVEVVTFLALSKKKKKLFCQLRTGCVLPSCSGVWDPYMGVLEPVPYMGVWEPYMGVRPWVEVIPLCLFAPLERRRRTRVGYIKIRTSFLFNWWHWSRPLTSTHKFWHQVIFESKWMIAPSLKHFCQHRRQLITTWKRLQSEAKTPATRPPPPTHSNPNLSGHTW